MDARQTVGLITLATSIILSGCSTVKAIETPVVVEPKVTLTFKRFEPRLEWSAILQAAHGDVELFMLGKNTLEVRIEPPGLFVWYEQSPDLINWVPKREPVTTTVIESTYDYLIQEITFESIPTLMEEPTNRQFFRANY